MDQASSRGPTVVDRGFQFAYVCAYQLMRTYWRLSRPNTHGTLVTMWNAGEVLLVRNSYVNYYSAPGGYVRGGSDRPREQGCCEQSGNMAGEGRRHGAFSGC